MDVAEEYAGFWIRVGASLIDSLLICLIIWPLLMMVYGPDYLLKAGWTAGTLDFLLSWVFPAVAIVAFWIYRSATPGKMALRLIIVDADSGEKPTTGQFVLRYLGYFVSMIPFMLGLIWVGIDERKQGFHDKIARTVVIHKKHKVPVRFGQS
jgi:uncharacterized RDD family membrane protein YckC